MRAEEKVIQERRTIEATKKNIMGVEGKLVSIAKYLGDPLIRQGSKLFDQTFMEDPYDISEDDEIRTSEDGDVHYEEGWIFSGLSRGLHLDIHFHEDENKITVWYKGYEVYLEEAGDLLTYAPFQEWENIVERLYKVARKKEQDAKNDLVGEIEQQVMKEKRSFFQRLRMKWGI